MWITYKSGQQSYKNDAPFLFPISSEKNELFIDIVRYTYVSHFALFLIFGTTIYIVHLHTFPPTSLYFTLHYQNDNIKSTNC